MSKARTEPSKTRSSRDDLLRNFVRSALCTRSIGAMRSQSSKDSPREPDEPLPLTLRFVFVLGGLILVGWFLMFVLLQSRW